MRRVVMFLMLALVGLGLGGCGSGWEWFPEVITIGDFTFTAVTDATGGATVTSNAVTMAISGSSDTAAISITGDASSKYSINGALFTNVPGKVKNGDKVTVQQVASRTAGGTVTSVLTVGTKTASFTSTTSATATVTAFSITPSDVFNAVPGSVQTSDPVTLAITGAGAAISVSGDASSEYSINGGTFTKTAGTVVNKDLVRVRNTAPGAAGQSVVTTLTVGDKSSQFASSTGNVRSETVEATGPADTLVTAPVILHLVTGTHTIEVIDGFGGYSVSGADGEFFHTTDVPQTVTLTNGSSLFMQDFAPPALGDVSPTTITIDGVPIIFNVRTTAS